MNIGVIRKWKPEDINPSRHPNARRLAQSLAGRIDPSKLRRTESSGTTGCSSCGDTGKDELGNPCQKCWRPLSNRAVDTMAEGDIEDRNDPLLFLSEPMDLAFRLLKGQGQSIGGNKQREELIDALAAMTTGSLDDEGALPEDQVGIEEEGEPEEEEETAEQRLARFIDADPELRDRKRKQPSHALAGQRHKRFQAGPNHPDHALYQPGKLGLED